MADKTWVLATGGGGFIGSHVVVELVSAGYGVVILDNFENAATDIPDRLFQITGVDIPTIRGDVQDRPLVEKVLAQYGIDVVIHLAGKKAVGESVALPLIYYGANVSGGITLLEAMGATGVSRLLFSSSATVYGPSDQPMTEDYPVSPSSPYGRTKLMLEEIITDTVASGAIEHAISLRYFNPVGAHSSGLIGESPRATPNNLFPFIAQTAAGLQKKVRVFGQDYDTPDGTGVRDYIHVVDLARGHVAAVSHLISDEGSPSHVRLNLGTGTGHSVKEAIAAFSHACGFQVPHEFVPRRPGDIASCVANPRKAERLLDWRAELSFERMCLDHWAFQRTAARNSPKAAT